MLEKNQKVLDRFTELLDDIEQDQDLINRDWLSGCSSAWLERSPWARKVAGPNPVTPTIRS